MRRRFDFNNDGKLSAFERSMEFMSIREMVLANERAEAEEAAVEEHDELMTDLELVGLDYDELEFMEEDERREALEDAGLDPEDYDF